MPGFELITGKLIKMKEYLNQLKKIAPGTYRDYLKDLVPKYAVERLIQLIVDLALDINNISEYYCLYSPARNELLTNGPEETCLNPFPKANSLQSSKVSGLTYSTTDKWFRVGCKY